MHTMGVRRPDERTNSEGRDLAGVRRAELHWHSVITDCVRGKNTTLKL